MKNLYLVKRTDEWDYDEYEGFVVCAKSQKDAKAMCEDSEGWSPDKISVKHIGTAVRNLKIGTVLSSFNAG